MKATIVLREEKKKGTRIKSIESEVLLNLFELLKKVNKNHSEIQKIIDRLEECSQVLVSKHSDEIIFQYPDESIYSMPVNEPIIAEMFYCFL